MDEMISVLQDILLELREINGKLDDIKGYSSDNSLSDVCSKLDDITGDSLYNNLTDVCEKLDSVESAISSLTI